MIRIYLLLVLGLVNSSLFAQIKNNGDVLQYDVFIQVSDLTNNIEVLEKVYVALDPDQEVFKLNLKQKDVSGKGMSIIERNSVTENRQVVEYKFENDTLYIFPKHLDSVVMFEFKYQGIPQNGLIIGENKFNERTFFADNWPNRAQHWLACVDHPTEKARVNFSVKAPKHYSCIATGNYQGFRQVDNDYLIHRFKSEYNLPSKVMVIGLANFSIQKEDYQKPFPLTSWVYSSDQLLGFESLSSAGSILDFFIDYIGEYPYEKLANVQSTTMFGGMENAGNIFYDEHAFNGAHSMDALLAHEIVHQWFGNSASEKDWEDLWLSEGFATYLTDLYWLESHGVSEFRNRLDGERNRAIAFSKKYNHPVVDTNYNQLMDLLNANSYQKGAWVLHMLREKLGPETFQKVITTYYEEYAYGNASTNDFMRVAEKVSGQDLHVFFDQWLYNGGHPLLQGKKSLSGKKLKLKQLGNYYEFPIEFLLKHKDGTIEYATFDINASPKTIIKLNKKVQSFELDPNVKLFFEEI